MVFHFFCIADWVNISILNCEHSRSILRIPTKNLNLLDIMMLKVTALYYQREFCIASIASIVSIERNTVDTLLLRILKTFIIFESFAYLAIIIYAVLYQGRESRDGWLMSSFLTLCIKSRRGFFWHKDILLQSFS